MQSQPAAGDGIGSMMRRAARMAKRIQHEVARTHATPTTPDPAVGSPPPARTGRSAPPSGSELDLYKRVFSRSPIPLALLDEDLCIITVNTALSTLMEQPAAAFVGRSVAELSAPPHPARVVLMAQKAAATGDPVIVEHRFSRGGEAEGWARTSIQRIDDEDGRIVLVAVVEDITTDHQALEQQRREAELDPLTGLLNRRGGDRRLRAALSHLVQRGPVAVIVADVDHFKEINDQFGHATGDEVLSGIAGRLRAAIRQGDDVARLGGDEFIVVAGVADRAEAETIASRCVNTVAEPIRSRRTGGPHQVTLSAGVAITYPDGPVTVDALVEAADRALYRAKAGGGNQVVFADAPFGPGTHPSEASPAGRSN